MTTGNGFSVGSTRLSNIADRIPNGDYIILDERDLCERGRWADLDSRERTHFSVVIQARSSSGAITKTKPFYSMISVTEDINT
jgi:hypothetical protein